MPLDITIRRNKAISQAVVTKSLAQEVVKSRIENLKFRGIEGDSGMVLVALDIAMTQNRTASGWFGPYQFLFTGRIK